VKEGIAAAVIALILAAVVPAGAFGYTYIATSSQISSLKRTTSSQSSVISSQNSIISSQQQVQSQQSSQIATMSAGISALRENISSIADQRATLQTQVASDQTQISADQANVTALVSQRPYPPRRPSSRSGRASWRRQSHSETRTWTSLRSPSRCLLQNDTYTPEVQVVNFTAQYSAYVSLVYSDATNATLTGPLVVNDYSPAVSSPTYSGVFNGPFFRLLSNETLVVPVAPGSVAILLVNFIPAPESANITATYYW
jgi:hypothetical protein